MSTPRLKDVFRRFDLGDSYDNTTTANEKFGPWSWIGESVTVANDSGTTDLEVRLVMTGSNIVIKIAPGEVWNEDLVAVEHLEWITGSIPVRAWVFGHSRPT
jgi:hypothetical protein